MLLYNQFSCWFHCPACPAREQPPDEFEMAYLNWYCSLSLKGVSSPGTHIGGLKRCGGTVTPHIEL